MRRKLAAGLIVLWVGVFAAGCASSPAPSLQKDQPGNAVAAPVSPPADEAWLREPFYRGFDAGVRDIVERELNVLRFNLDDDPDPEYLAWVKLDRLNGLGILFDARGGRYEPVYEIREPIDQVSFHQSSRSLIVAAGHGGTGLQQNWFRVIREVDGSFREVWTGIERSLLFVVPPFTERYGSVTITSRPDDTWVLRHANTYALLDERYGILERRDRADEYLFGPGQDRFTPAGDVPDTGRHLVLDREETFGEAIFGRIVGLDGDALGSVTVELAGKGGDVLAVAGREGADGFLLTPPGDLAPGTYDVRLVRPDGEEKAVLDRMALVVRRR